MRKMYNKNELFGKSFINHYNKHKDRIYWLDNIKFFLILSVVTGHFTQHYIENNEQLNFLHYFFSFYTMPAFIFITGFFSKKNGTDKTEQVIKYAFLYLIMQVIECSLGGANLSIIKPGFTLWYLQAIIMYKLFVDAINLVKPIPLLIFSLFLGLFIGFDNFATTVGSASRIITMFPYFLLGYNFDNSMLWNIKKKRNIGVSVIIFSIFIIIIFLIINGSFKMPIEMLYGKTPYKEMGLGTNGVFYRLLWYLISMAISFSIFAFIPKSKINFVSKFGTRTLQVYCLHALVFLLFQNSTPYFYLKTLEPISQSIVLLLGSVLLTLVLSLKIFSLPFDLIMKRKHIFMK